jgi:heme exporter protein A
VSSPPLRVRELVHAYDDTPVLRIPELTLSEGVYHLAGPNGAGKTTLLRVLATLTRPTTGDVEVAGHPWPDEARQARAALGFAGHDPSLHASLPAREALAVHARLHGLAPALVDEALEAWSLARVADRRVDELSHGQRRRLDLARALLHEPDVVLLDEPTSGLDEAAADLVGDRLAELDPRLALVADPERAPVPVDDRLALAAGRVEARP